MFKREKCKKCGEKIKKKYSFCPYCGSRLNFNDSEDYGLLGKNDLQEQTNELKLPLGFNSIVNSLLKNMEIEMKEIDKTEMPNLNNRNGIGNGKISISISTGRPSLNGHGSLGSNEKNIKKEELKLKLKKNVFDEEKAKKFSSLKKQEPKTDLKRFSNKVVYELDIPQVKNIEDISIHKLENSIEIKAIGKEIGYSKIIPISLPLHDYSFSQGKLLLDFNVKN